MGRVFVSRAWPVRRVFSPRGAHAGRARGRLPALCLALCAACAAEPAPGAHPRAAEPVALRPMRADDLEHNNGERDSDLLAIELDLAIHFRERRIEGSVTNRIRALVDGTRAIRYHCAELDVASVHDSRGRELAFAIEPPWLAIELDRPLAHGDEEALTIAYSGRPQRGLYFVDASKDAAGFAPQVWSQSEPEETRYWIPTWDYPSDRARFEARFHVDEDMQALSNGVLLDVRDDGGGVHTYHWKLDREIPTYLIALAAGRFEHYSDAWRGLPLDYYVGPGTGEEKARRAFGETPRMLEYFAALLGEPFPFPKYAQVAVADFVMAGMENASLTLETDDILADADEALDLDGDPRLLVAHELAHQWFGDLVTCFGWSNLWLNEGWASYMELLYEGHVAGRESMRSWLEGYREAYLARGVLTRLPLSETWRSQASASRCNHEYDKGPWVLYMIHRELGDAAFWQGVHAYLERHKGGLVTSADFARAIFDSTGRNVYGMIQQWVEAAGHPIYRVSFDGEHARAGRGSLALRVEQVQELDELVPLFDMPVTIGLYYGNRGDGGERGDGRVEKREIRVSQRDETFEVPVDGPLVDVVFDVEGGVLCEIRLEKDTAMWVHQSQIVDEAPARWRALDPLRERAGASAAARAALIERVRSDDQPLVRERAAVVCTFAEARGALLDAVEQDVDARVRLASARVLGTVPPSSAEIDRARQRLARERSPAVRVELMRWLGIVDAPAEVAR
jgi:aminopeptidase N